MSKPFELLLSKYTEQIEVASQYETVYHNTRSNVADVILRIADSIIDDQDEASVMFKRSVIYELMPVFKDNGGMFYPEQRAKLDQALCRNRHESITIKKED